MEDNRQVRRGSLIVPLMLVFLGFVLLLSNLGYLAWSPGQVASRLWPLLLVAVGLDVLLGRRAAGGPWALLGLLVVMAVLAVVGVGAFLLAPVRIAGWSANGPMVVAAGPMSSEVFSQPLNDARRGEVTLSFGVGNLQLGAQEAPSGLIEGTVTHRQGEPVIRNSHRSGETIYFEMREEEAPAYLGPGSDRFDGHSWDLRLNPEVPIQLKVNGGVGRSNLDLSGLKVTDLTINTGVGESELILPRQGQLQATVKGGISDTTILIPRGMPARVQTAGGLTRVEVADQYQRQGDSFVSPGYEDAGDRVDLMVKGGIGKITVREYAVQ